MTTFYLKIEVDQFADDSQYDLLVSRLKCSIVDQIYAEPVVDAVKVIREDDICD